MVLLKEKLCFIVVGIIISDVYGLQPPRYVSDWYVMDTEDRPTNMHTWTHGFGVVPYMHEVQMQSASGFIYPGVKSGNADNDASTPRGGVVCIYDDNTVKVFSPYLLNLGGHLIYTGTTSYTPQNQESTQTASVRVRLWHPDDFPTPAQTLKDIELQAGNDSNNYKVQDHTLGQVPALTIVQYSFVTEGKTWYGEGMGSSNHLSRDKDLNKGLNWGGIVFGVNSKDVQLWAPSGWAAGGVINFCDGYGTGVTFTAPDCFPKSNVHAVITIRMWKDLCSKSVADLTTSHAIGDSGDSHEYSLASTFDVDTDLVIVESVAVDGQFAGYHFYATGAAVFDGAGALGGMIYAYNGSAVRLWHPVTAGSYLIKVGEHMGPSPGYAHVSTQTNTTIRVWKGGSSGTPAVQAQFFELFHVQSGTMRDISWLSKEVLARSRIECAIICKQDVLCKGANYKDQTSGSGEVCRLFSEGAETTDLSADPDWKYMNREENNRK